MASSSSTGMLPEEELWVELPEELLLKVLDELGWCDSRAVRATCRRWRAIHDAGCKTLLTALTWLGLHGSNVTDSGLQELTTLTSLTRLSLWFCSTSKAGRDALKAAIPGLVTYPS